MSDALYNGQNRVIIDDNTPETNTLPVSGGKGIDEFLITRTANSVVIDDDSEANVIVFERDVVITSIESQTGSEGASIAQYVITLSSGKTITLRNPASFTFQHLGDATRTAPIPAEDFFTAYEDGFAASDASHPDIIGDASGPSGVQGPMITGAASETGSVVEDRGGGFALGTGPGLIVALQGGNGVSLRPDGSGDTQYGNMGSAFSSSLWIYTLSNANEATQKLAAGQTVDEVFTFVTGTGTFDVIITITGTNDAPVVATAIESQSGMEGQEKVIDLSTLFSDIDTGDTLILSVAVELDGNEITFDGSRNIISNPNASKMLRITLASAGTYEVTVVADDGNGGRGSSSFNLEVEADTPPAIGIPGSEDRSGVGAVTEDGTLTATGVLEVTDADNPPTLPAIELDGDGVGPYGTMTFDAGSGEWTYTLDNNHTTVQGLGGSETLTETFTFTALGAENFAVEITITGTNDAPVVATAIEPQSGVEGREKVIDLSTLFSDVDEGDELTFEVTLDDGAALDTIGLTYDSDEDEITGTLTGTGTYVIKIVATDKSGATVETTFDLNILSAIPTIQINSITYNPDETRITIDETMLKITSADESDPFYLFYTITTLPDAGFLLYYRTQLDAGDYFTQWDINNGHITYRPAVTNPSASQSNPLSFTISVIGEEPANPEEYNLKITSREVVENTAPAEDNEIDRSTEATPQKIEAGNGSDTITGGTNDDQIDGGAGDDEIILTHTVNDVAEDTGADEVLYTFGYDSVGIDGGDEIIGFKRGQDKLTFVIDRNFNSLTEFLQSLNGDDETDLTADDAFIVTIQWGTNEDGSFYFDGVLLHFKDASVFGGGRISSPLVQITFDERLNFDDLVEILGGEHKIADNFDFTHAALKNLDEVLPRLFGENSIKGGEPALEFPFNIISNVDNLTKISGDGGVNAKIGNTEATSSQFLTGGDHAQTLNAGNAGDLIFGGRGYDIINLGDGKDIVIYRYRHSFGNDSIAYDGGDVINNFNLGEDILVLAQLGLGLHNNLAAFLDTIGFSLLLDEDGNIIGIQFIFTENREASALGDTLFTLNFEESISSENIDFTAFNAAVDNKRTIKPDQKAIAYQELNKLFTEGHNLALINFEDSNFIDEIIFMAPNQILIDDDNIQTLNLGPNHNLIFGGKGDDIINLDDGTDNVIYRYDAVIDEGNLIISESAAFDGVDVINDFDLDKDFLNIYHTDGHFLYDDNVTSNEDKKMFFNGIKSISLLESAGKITGIVFTFDDEIDLTVNFQEDDFISYEDENIDLTPFNEEESGRRTIKTGQEDAAYETIINKVFPFGLLLSDHIIVSGYGIDDVTIGNKDANTRQFLIGGDNKQTLNSGQFGDLILGGKGDDIINLEINQEYGGLNSIIYHYDGTDKTNSAALDGNDVINGFDLDGDVLRLLHVGNNAHSTTTEFYAAIKGVSLLTAVIYGNEIITGIVFTFTDRDTPTEEIDLTVNFDDADFIPPQDTDLTAFNKEDSGRRTIKTGQEDPAYEVIDAILGDAIFPENYHDVYGFQNLESTIE